MIQYTIKGGVYLIYLQINISYISLPSVSFEIINPNSSIYKSNLSITKDNIVLTLNDEPFFDFTIKSDTSNPNIYMIIPNTNFSKQDNLYIQVKSSSFVSNKLKILFSKALIDGKTKTDFHFFKYNPNKNKYVFTLTSINDMPFNLSTKPITVSNPIDQLKSEIIPNKSTYESGEIVYVTIRLIDIYNKPVPDGLYKIELNYTNAI